MKLAASIFTFFAFLILSLSVSAIDVILGINTGVMEPCDVSAGIVTSKDMYKYGDKIEFFNKLNDETYKFRIEYWIEDDLGEVLYKKKNTSNTKMKSIAVLKKWNGSLVLKNNVYPECDDYNESDNYAEKLIYIGDTDISNNPEKSEKVNKNKKIQKNLKLDESDKLDNPNISEKVVYTSSNTKLKKIAPWLFIAITTVICVVLVWKR